MDSKLICISLQQKPEYSLLEFIFREIIETLKFRWVTNIATIKTRLWGIVFGMSDISGKQRIAWNK
jgi:hypothetical protein